MVSLLFSFRGRISRKQYWFGTTLVGFLSLIGRMMTTALQAGSLLDVKDHADGLAGAAGSSMVALPVFVLIVWCSLAVQFKRFHDRGRTGWISMAPMVFVALLAVSVLGDVFAGAPLEKTLSDALPYFALLMLMGLAFFIDLGCLPSVEGPNKYGPPPGAPRGPMEPARPSGAVDAASALFGAQSAVDRAVAERNSQPQVQRVTTPTAPPARAPAFAAKPAARPPAPVGFGRRLTS